MKKGEEGDRERERKEGLQSKAEKLGISHTCRARGLGGNVWAKVACGAAGVVGCRPRRAIVSLHY